jgi:hypothetical protein
MAWASQLWKQYDPINGIIFPGASLKTTYNHKGKGRVES